MYREHQIWRWKENVITHLGKLTTTLHWNMKTAFVAFKPNQLPTLQFWRIDQSASQRIGFLSLEGTCRTVNPQKTRNRCSSTSKQRLTCMVEIHKFFKVEVVYFYLHLHCAFTKVRLDTPCNNLTNPRKLSFPSVCLIQSWRTTWSGIEGPSPSSWKHFELHTTVSPADSKM